MADLDLADPQLTTLERAVTLALAIAKLFDPPLNPQQRMDLSRLCAQAIKAEDEACARVIDALAAERQDQMDDPRNTRVAHRYFLDMRAAYEYAAKAIRARSEAHHDHGSDPEQPSHA